MSSKEPLKNKSLQGKKNDNRMLYKNKQRQQMYKNNIIKTAFVKTAFIPAF